MLLSSTWLITKLIDFSEVVIIFEDNILKLLGNEIVGGEDSGIFSPRIYFLPLL